MPLSLCETGKTVVVGIFGFNLKGYYIYFHTAVGNHQPESFPLQWLITFSLSYNSDGRQGRKVSSVIQSWEVCFWQWLLGE